MWTGCSVSSIRVDLAGLRKVQRMAAETRITGSLRLQNTRLERENDRFRPSTNIKPGRGAQRHVVNGWGWVQKGAGFPPGSCHLDGFIQEPGKQACDPKCLSISCIPNCVYAGLAALMG